MLQWDSTMETQVAVVDRQHKDLLRHVNELLSAMKVGKGREAIGEMLVFLGKYAVEHFGTEEGLMRRNGYPGYETHKAIHEAFRKDFGSLAKGLQDSALSGSLMAIDVQRRVIDWLRNHILSVDQELGRYLKARGVA